jgi:hypothetical protein
LFLFAEKPQFTSLIAATSAPFVIKVRMNGHPYATAAAAAFAGYGMDTRGGTNSHGGGNSSTTTTTTTANAFDHRPFTHNYNPALLGGGSAPSPAGGGGGYDYANAVRNANPVTTTHDLLTAIQNFNPIHNRASGINAAAAATLFSNAAYAAYAQELSNNQHHHNNGVNNNTINNAHVNNMGNNNNNSNNHNNLPMTVPQNHHRRHSSLTEFLLMPQNMTGLDPIFPIASSPQTQANNSKNASNNHHHTTINGYQVPPNNNHHHHHQPNYYDFNNTSNNSLNNSSSIPMLVSSFSAPPTIPLPTPSAEPWLMDMHLDVPGLSLESLTGAEVLQRLRERTEDVVTKYIPCVEFLVQCQQDLRKGLALATLRVARSRNSAARQFHDDYIAPLPERFFRQNQMRMDDSALQEAYQGLLRLKADAKASERQGCEAVKNSFLGGMKEGESWGLRKWLSKHGNGLQICTDLECLLKACQKLDKNHESTVKLAALMRPLASDALTRLKRDVPASYQERSAAHPYLPFFHRLESALLSVSQFDPLDDGIICLDDDSDDEDDAVTEVPPPAPVPETNRKRKMEDSVAEPALPRAKAPKTYAPPQQHEQHHDFSGMDDTSSSSGDSDDESVVEVVAIKASEPIVPLQWTCANCNTRCFGTKDDKCCCGKGRLEDGLLYLAAMDDLAHAINDDAGKSKIQKLSLSHGKGLTRGISTTMSAPSKANRRLVTDEEVDVAIDAERMAKAIHNLASIFEQDNQDSLHRVRVPNDGFWDGPLYGTALRLFGTLLESPESLLLIHPEDEDRLRDAGIPTYSSVIRHPLCFKDIVKALLVNVHDTSTHPGCNSGRLQDKDLPNWNMWKASDLFQAIDLVMLNTLAYRKLTGAGKDLHRTKINRIRKELWSGINDILTENLCEDPIRRKKYTPTKRSEISGFVVLKNKVRG